MDRQRVKAAREDARAIFADYTDDPAWIAARAEFIEPSIPIDPADIDGSVNRRTSARIAAALQMFSIEQRYGK